MTSPFLHESSPEPEMMLSRLNSALQRLLSAASVLESTAVKKRSFAMLRRLLIAELVASTPLIAVAGSQGAGKTTLVSALYRLNDYETRWLRPNEGQGERLPVLILESDDVAEPEGRFRVWKSDYQGNFSIQEERAPSPAQFEVAVAGGRDDVLLPVLKVPRRYFADDSQGFLLLPGYEKIDSSNEEWQQLMRQALAGAIGSIVVTDRRRMSGADQAKIVDDLLDGHVGGALPIVVVSRTEGMDEFEVEQLRSTAGKLFRIPDAVRDRYVVMFGAADESSRADACEKVGFALGELVPGSAQSRGNQLASLRGALGELGEIMAEIREESGTKWADAEMGMDNFREILEKFDEAVDGLRSEYELRISKVLANHFRKASSALDSEIDRNHEGIINAVKKLPDNPTGRALQMRAAAMSAWNSGTAQQGSPALRKQLLSAMVELTSTRYRTIIGAESVPNGQQSLPASSLKEFRWDGGDLRLPTLRQVDAENIQLLMVSRPQGDSSEKEVNRYLESTVESLPALLLGFRCVIEDSHLEWQGSGVNAVAQASGDASGDDGKAGRDELKVWIKAGGALLLGVDVADGQVDMVKPLTIPVANLLTTFGVAGATATALAPWIVLLASAGAMVTVEAARRSRSDVDMAREVLDSIHSNARAGYMEVYDTSMARMREVLKAGLKRRYHLGDAFMMRERITKSIADVRAIRDELRPLLASQGHAL